MSNMIFSQSTNTNLTKCFPITTVNELYNGVKQGENLKLVLSKTEKALSESQNLVAEQKGIIFNQSEIISGKDLLLQNNQFITDQKIIVKESEIFSLQADINILKIKAKKEGRKKFWNGIKIGGVSMAVLGFVGLILVK